MVDIIFNCSDSPFMYWVVPSFWSNPPMDYGFVISSISFAYFLTHLPSLVVATQIAPLVRYLYILLKTIVCFIGLIFLDAGSASPISKSKSLSLSFNLSMACDAPFLRSASSTYIVISLMLPFSSSCAICICADPKHNAIIIILGFHPLFITCDEWGLWLGKTQQKLNFLDLIITNS